MCSERENWAEENHWPYLGFSSVNFVSNCELPETEGFGDFLSFLQVEMMCVGE